MFRAFFFSQRWLVVQSIILISGDVKFFRVLFLSSEMFRCSEYYSYSQRCLVVQSINLIPRDV